MIEPTDRYLKLRALLGYQDADLGRDLEDFAKFAAARGSSYLRAVDADAWVSQKSRSRRQYELLASVRRLGLFLHAEDNRHEVLLEDYTRPYRRPKRPIPYIYTEQEIRLLLSELGNMSFVNPYDAQTYKHMVGLIAATGLRLSEAQNILASDLQGTTILIRNSKFGKSRTVHIHQSTLDALCRYKHSRPVGLQHDNLFVIHNNRTPSQHSVDSMFRKCTIKLELNSRNGSKLPRIHDLRHTFAVRSLASCDTNRESISRHMIALSTYLGHVSIASTYWYLELAMDTKEMMAVAIEEVLYE
ncbi:tyrosine-type recombinase/integrase [Sphingomonas prati]|uniref:Integrase n=1 Tax=Sphingomonas prati TaxID=1843237 RepID=A0A7W9BVM6_9SPHN|nr:integrase [Sphingomonas prati]